jgi:hypothetical protein
MNTSAPPRSAAPPPNTAPARALTAVMLEMIAGVRSAAHKQSKDAALDLVDEIWETLTCVNCGRDIEEKKLYCSTFCAEFAGAVRYVRRVIADGRMNASDVQEGIGAKLLMLTGGGYPRLERALSAQIDLHDLRRPAALRNLGGRAARPR